MDDSKKDSPRPEITAPNHCTNCGQKVGGAVAMAAANPKAVFCCNCGFALAQDGKCVNNACRFLGFIPLCG